MAAKTSLAGRKIAYYGNSGRQIIAIVTTHDIDTDTLTMHQAVYADTLAPVNYRFGGDTIQADSVIVLNI